MSHSSERSEKICLNCRADLAGRYCHVCGQENIEPHQSVWHLVTHFFNDITHFDGKFFTTLKDLILKPGFLSKEYLAGRRTSYLDPIRMYIFTSAFFFIVFFSMIINRKTAINFQSSPKKIPAASAYVLAQRLKKAKSAADSAKIISSFSVADLGFMQVIRDSTNPDDVIFDSVLYKTTEDYNALQSRLPEGKRDGWLTRIFTRKEIELNNRYKQDKINLLQEYFEIFLHNFPKMFFISLPLFALLLSVLYIRKKQLYYVDHGIFSIHLYIFGFIALLFFFGLDKLRKESDWSWVDLLEAGILLFAFGYFYKALRNFYQQGRGKTILKFFLLSILAIIVQVVLFLCFLLFSVFEI